MYRATAMSALGPDHIPDVTEQMARRYAPASARTSRDFVIRWREKSGLIYWEKRKDGRYTLKQNGQPFCNEVYHTLAGARGRISLEAKREKGVKANAA